MRNYFYQCGFAEYMTPAALKDVPASELTQQSDATFIPVDEPQVSSKVELNRLKVPSYPAPPGIWVAEG